MIFHAVSDLLVGEKVVEMGHQMRVGRTYPEDC